MNLIEVQVDRLVGPTHHFGGLGVGNLASQEHSGQLSNPAAAALQGLDKMRLVASFGVPQIIIPPQGRPDFQFLRTLGFAGTDSDVLRRALLLIVALPDEAAGFLVAGQVVAPLPVRQQCPVLLGRGRAVAALSRRAREPQQRAGAARVFCSTEVVVRCVWFPRSSDRQ